MSKTICLDAGHALHGRNVKRVPDGMEEWLLNASVCDKIERYLNQYDVNIVRLDDVTGDNDYSISDRTEKAKSNNPIALISIHHKISDDTWLHVTDAFVNAYVSRNVHSKEQMIAEKILSKYHQYSKYENGHSHISKMLMCNYSDYVDDHCVKVILESPDLCNPLTYVQSSSEKGKEDYALSVAETLIEEFQLAKKNIITRSGETIMYLVRKSLHNSSSEKFRSTNLENAISICNEFCGHSVYNGKTGEVIHKSTFGKIPTDARRPYSLEARVNSVTGLALRVSEDPISDRIALLNYGSKVKILDRGVLNPYWHVEASVDGKMVSGYIYGKYLKLI